MFSLSFTRSATHNLCSAPRRNAVQFLDIESWKIGGQSVYNEGQKIRTIRKRVHLGIKESRHPLIVCFFIVSSKQNAHRTIDLFLDTMSSNKSKQSRHSTPDEIGRGGCFSKPGTPSPANSPSIPLSVLPSGAPPGHAPTSTRPSAMVTGSAAKTTPNPSRPSTPLQPGTAHAGTSVQGSQDEQPHVKEEVQIVLKDDVLELAKAPSIQGVKPTAAKASTNRRAVLVGTFYWASTLLTSQ